MIASIVPAAGHSQRMGRPKLILPALGRTVIARVVNALRDGGVEMVIVVTPPADAPGASVLVSEAMAAGATPVIPLARPGDMRTSVEIALTQLEGRDSPPKFVLLTPADSLDISAGLVARVIAEAMREPGSIVIPVCQGRRGHPIALPWEIALRVRDLPAGVGVNALVGLYAGVVVELPVDDPGAVRDLDTPEDYQRWLAENPAEAVEGPCA